MKTLKKIAITLLAIFVITTIVMFALTGYFVHDIFNINPLTLL